MARTILSHGLPAAGAARSVTALRLLVIGMMALSLGFVGFWAGRAHAEALAVAAVAMVVDPVLVTGSGGVFRAGPEIAGATTKTHAAAPDEPAPWAMLVAGLLGAGIIVRRRSG